MTTAKVEYFSGKYNLGYYHLNFYGDDSKYYNHRWNEIEHKKYNNNKKQINECKYILESCERSIEDYRNRIKSSKKWFQFWYTHVEKDLRKQIKQEQERIDELSCKIGLLENDLFYDHQELRWKGEEFLQSCGFVLTNASTSRVYHGSPSKTEIWTKN